MAAEVGGYSINISDSPGKLSIEAINENNYMTIRSLHDINESINNMMRRIELICTSPSAIDHSGILIFYLNFVNFLNFTDEFFNKKSDI